MAPRQVPAERAQPQGAQSERAQSEGAEAARTGCPFRPSCDRALPKCAVEDPELVDVGAGHLVACHALM